VSSSSPVFGTIVPPALRNPYIDGKIAHPGGFRPRRFLNWFPLGVAYAMLYMGRYNLTVAQGALGGLISKEDFGNIFGIGAVVYGFAFLLNGPLTDRIGGRKAMLLALGGAFAANLGIGLYVRSVLLSPNPAAGSMTSVLSILYALNMYFQSFGAVSIVKVNASWFHVRERGGFSGIFGIMISSGIYLAFDVNEWLLGTVKGTTPAGEVVPSWIVFLAPAAGLLVMLVLEALFLRDWPSHAGHYDIDTGDASSGEEHADLTTGQLMKRILTNPVIMTVAAIEFCTGVLRNGVMHWFRIYAKEQAALTGASEGWAFTLLHWGFILMIAGIIGGNVAGWVSDKVFSSRRAPAAGLLYGLLCVCTAAMFFLLGNAWVLCGIVFLVSLAVIGTHGLLSGTATMDFGGRKGAATAVGVIDGFVYLGTAVQSFSLGYITSNPNLGWKFWPAFLLPFGLLGLFLLTRIWHAMPKGRKAGGH
jgi:MFS transporter, OPA family, glycerol-3-phosphate transporter